MELTDKEYTEKLFKKLEQVYYWLIAIPLIFVSLGFLGVEGGIEARLQFSESTITFLQILLPILLLVDIGFLHFFYRNRMQAVDSAMGLRDKLMFFRRQSLVIYLGGFFYSLVLTVLYYLTHIQVVLPLYLGLLLYLTFRRPSVSKAANDLKLDAETYKSINYRAIPLDRPLDQ